MCAMLRTTLKCEDGEFPVNFAVLTDYQEWRVMLCPAVERRFAVDMDWPVGWSISYYRVMYPFPVCDENKWLASRAGARRVYVFLIALRWDDRASQPRPALMVYGPSEVLGYWGVLEPGNTDTIWVACHAERGLQSDPSGVPAVGEVVNPLTHRTFVPELARCTGYRAYWDSHYYYSQYTDVSADMRRVNVGPYPPYVSMPVKGRMGYNWHRHQGMFRRSGKRNTERLVRSPDPKTGAGMRILEPSVEEIRRQIERVSVGVKSSASLKEKLKSLGLNIKTSDGKTHTLRDQAAHPLQMWRTFVWEGDPMDLMLADCCPLVLRTVDHMEKYMSARQLDSATTSEPYSYFLASDSYYHKDSAYYHRLIITGPRWWVGGGWEPEPGDPVGYVPAPPRLPEMNSKIEVEFDKCDKYARAIIEDPSAPQTANRRVSFECVRVYVVYGVELLTASGALVDKLYLHAPHPWGYSPLCHFQFRKAVITIGAKWPEPEVGPDGKMVVDAGELWRPGWAWFVPTETYRSQVLTWQEDGKYAVVQHFLFHAKLKYAQKYSYPELDEMFTRKYLYRQWNYAPPGMSNPDHVLEVKSQYRHIIDTFYAGTEMRPEWHDRDIKITTKFFYPPDLTPGRVVGEYGPYGRPVEPVLLGNTVVVEYFGFPPIGFVGQIANGYGVEIWPEHASRMYLFNNPALVQTEGRPLKFTWEPFS